MLRNTPLKRTSGLAPKSKLQQARENAQARTPTGGPCQVRPYLVEGVRRARQQGDPEGARALARAVLACPNIGSTRHHRRKQSAMGSDGPDNLMLCCGGCNGVIEDQAGLVRELSETLATDLGWRRLVVREGDPEWEALAR